jgi:hypothetical protein
MGSMVLGIASAGTAATHEAKKPSSDFWETFAPTHVLDISEWASQDRTTYRCATPAAARVVVQAIPQSAKASHGVRESRFKAALKTQHCVAVTSGKFKPTLSYGDAPMSANEPDEVWEALAATDAAGKTIGLIFNTSVF